MKSKIFHTLALITASTLILGDASYGGDQKRTPTPKVIEDAFTKDEKLKERVQKRVEARSIQKKGEDLKKNLDSVTTPLKSAGTTAGIVASASGDPHAKAAAAAFRLSISAIDLLGKTIAQIVVGVGRYQERSQQILSNIEVLVEDVQKSIDKKKRLEKKLQELLDVEKPPEPSQSSSRLKQLGKGALNAVKTAEIKVRQATDVLTNEKAKREEKIKEIQADLKVENENYNEALRLLQIILMQDAVKEIDKHIHITDTISGLDKDAEFYKKAKNKILDSKPKQKKQISEIEKKEAQINKDLVHYLTFRRSIPESDDALQDPIPKEGEIFGEREEFIKKLKDGHPIKKLVGERKSLRDKIAELTQLTKRGDILYLQEKEVDLDSEVNKSSFFALYREIDEIKSQLAALSKTSSTKATTPGPVKKDNAASPSKPVSRAPSNRGSRSSWSEEEIRKQLEALRPANTGK